MVAYQIFTVVQAAMLSLLAAIWQLTQHVEIIPTNHWAGSPVLVYHVTLTYTQGVMACHKSAISTQQMAV